MKPQSLVHRINEIMGLFRFSDWEVCALKSPISLSFYKNFLKAGYQGEMNYLSEHLEQKSNPRLLRTKDTEFHLESSIVIIKEYFPHPQPQDPLPYSPKAKYARGEDYHFWFKKELMSCAETFKVHWPNDEFLCYTDSGPILEKDLAYQAGLGWFGKNTCLIQRGRGSFFFIGEILTTLPSNARIKTSRDFCGNCNRCMEACPTQALVAPRIMDATRCIAYWNIESRSLPPEDLRPAIGVFFFGCDICQDVCPHNFRHTGNTPEFSRPGFVSELRWVLRTSHSQIEKSLKFSPLLRARPLGLKRNALLCAAHYHLTELKIEIESFLSHPKLAPLARWVFQELFPEKLG